MKRLFLILLSVLPLVGSAQESDVSSFLKEGKVWNYECTYHGIDDQGQMYTKKADYKEWIEGDTVIMGRKYFKMRSSAIDFPIATASFWREEENRVYAYHKENDSEELMYDFNLKAGDTVDMLGMNGIGVDKVDAITVSGIERKRIFIGPSIWVEGIGNPYLLAEPLGHFLADGNVSCLLSCYENDMCVFEASDFNLEGSTNDIREVMHDKLKPSSLFDLQGRRLSGKPAYGVYIQDGRKRVVR